MPTIPSSSPRPTIPDIGKPSDGIICKLSDGQQHLVTFATADGRVAQRSALTSGHKTILAALDLPEPPKYLDFTPGIDTAVTD